MLFFISLFLLAAILVFQGVHLLGEQSEPMGVVPVEVRPDAVNAARFGGFLVAVGVVLIAAGVLSFSYPWLVAALAPLRGLGCFTLLAFSVWMVFGRKIDYTPAPVAQDAHGHH